MTLSMDACQGDSGGPVLRVEKSSGNLYLLGLTSLGIRCGDHGSPGGYVSVRGHASWLCALIGILCTAGGRNGAAGLSGGAQADRDALHLPWSQAAFRSNISLDQFNATRRCHPVEVGAARMRMDMLGDGDGDVSVAPRITNGVSNLHLRGANFNASHVPFLATLEDWAGNGFCGGVAIAPDLLLTVAHCLGAHLAAVSFRQGGGAAAMTGVPVREWAAHPRFTARMANDIGVVRFARALPASVLPALPADAFVAPPAALLAATGQQRPALLIAGRGAEAHGGHFSDRFSLGVVSLISAAECLQTQVGAYIDAHLGWGAMFCAMDLTHLTEYAPAAADCLLRDSCLFRMDGVCDEDGGPAGDCLPNTDCSDCHSVDGFEWGGNAAADRATSSPSVMPPRQPPHQPPAVPPSSSPSPPPSSTEAGVIAVIVGVCFGAGFVCCAAFAYFVRD